MAIRRIRYNGDPILRKRCQEVRFVDNNIRHLLSDMVWTLYHTKNAMGLAACQIGILKRLVVIHMNGKSIKLINPKIIKQSGMQRCIEGCLSCPNIFGRTIRPQKVTIQALNEKGEQVILEGEGELAKCLCHEIDHLDGILFVDKVIEFL